jgi:hypothetical protein
LGLSRLGRLVPIDVRIDRARRRDRARSRACVRRRRLLELRQSAAEQAAGRGGDVLGPADRLGESRAACGRQGGRRRGSIGSSILPSAWSMR